MKPDPRAQLAAVPTEICYLYNNTIAIRQHVAEREAKLIAMAKGAVPSGSAWHPQNYIGNLLPNLEAHLPLARFALSTLESTAEFQAAEKLIVPILEAVAALEAAEAKAAQELADKQRKVADALAAAEQRALADARKDPAVLAAQAALAAVR
jgi:hypothetical protein